MLINNTGMKIGSNKDINKGHKKLLMTSPGPDEAEGAAPKMEKPIKDCFGAQHGLIDNPKMLAKKHNDEKLAIIILIVGAGLISYHFW